MTLLRTSGIAGMLLAIAAGAMQAQQPASPPLPAQPPSSPVQSAPAAAGSASSAVPGTAPANDAKQAQAAQQPRPAAGCQALSGGKQIIRQGSVRRGAEKVPAGVLTRPQQFRLFSGCSGRSQPHRHGADSDGSERPHPRRRCKRSGCPGARAPTRSEEPAGGRAPL